MLVPYNLRYAMSEDGSRSTSQLKPGPHSNLILNAVVFLLKSGLLLCEGYVERVMIFADN